MFSLIPSRYYLELPAFHLMIFYAIMFIGFYCDSAGQVIYITFILAIQMLVIKTVGYSKFSVSIMLSGLTMVILFFLFCSFIAMIIVYTKNLETKKDNALKANIQLIDGMHEGLLILQKKTETIETPKQLFCNRPAMKLLGTYLGGGNYSSVHMEEYL